MFRRSLGSAHGLSVRLDRRQILLGAASAAFASTLARAATLPPLAQDVASLGAPDSILEGRITALANEAGLRIGFAAVDLVKGRTAFVRGGELFPMQSITKLPIAVAYLSKVQRGEAKLDTTVRLSAVDVAPGRSPLADKLRRKPTVFTARQLIEHMILNGDNTATDALMKIAGGPEKIQLAVRRFEIEGLRVDRYERDLQPQALGLEANAGLGDDAMLDKAVATLEEGKQRDALQRFMRDPRDTASPRAIATLFFKLQSGHLIQPRFAMLVLDLMRRTKTGEDRLRGGMLPGWTFAHRGGVSRTVLGTTAVFNDAGLATNTKKGEKIAIVLFIEGATMPVEELARFHRATSRAVLQAWG
jgi:beta-lactamase class A